MSKTVNIDAYVNRLNSIIEKHKSMFIVVPIFVKKLTNKDKNYYEINSYDQKIFLKSNFKDDPFIEVKERWVNDARDEYCYKFTVPSFNFVCAFNTENSGTTLNNFQFRYEIHTDKEDKRYNKNHLHFFDNGNLKQHYPSGNIDFSEFFEELIVGGFVKNNKVDFTY